MRTRKLRKGEVLTDAQLSPGWTILKDTRIAVHTSGMSLRFTETKTGWHLVADNTKLAAASSMNVETAEKDAHLMVANNLI